MKTTRRSKAPADAFLRELLPGCDPDAISLNVDRARAEVVELARVAFFLYERDWGKDDYDIAGWVWPLNTLRQGGDISGSEPWKVLLAEAVRLAKLIPAKE